MHYMIVEPCNNKLLLSRNLNIPVSNVRNEPRPHIQMHLYQGCNYESGAIETVSFVVAIANNVRQNNFDDITIISSVPLGGHSSVDD